MLLVKENKPNAGKLIQSLRSVGYDNYNAIADLIDNSIDAGAQNIRINIDKINNDVEIIIIDDGCGMDYETLDQALRLGSEIEKNPLSDLGKYGMGLCTASLSICKRLEVLTRSNKENSKILSSIHDVDEIEKANDFIKYLDFADKNQQEKFDFFLKESSGTIVSLKNSDKIQNANVASFANKLKKDLGQMFRYFIFAGKNIYVNGDLVKVNDPIWRSHKETKIYSDAEYEILIPEKKLKEKIRVIISLLPDFSVELMKEYGIGIKTQGFYVLRNNREIAAAKTLDVFTKHNSLNRMRIELLFTGKLDEEMGVNFAKQNISPTQGLHDKIAEVTKGQIDSIKRMNEKQSAKSQSMAIDHTDAEKVISNKKNLLITPETIKEKRGPRVNIVGPRATSEDKENRKRLNLQRIQKLSEKVSCEFGTFEGGESGEFYQCFLEGKVILIDYNIDHPFYRRMILENKNSREMLNAIDYIVYSMASAELKNYSDDNADLLSNIKSIMSTNLRTLLS